MRKPTRFWHPARRVLLRAQEQALALAARRKESDALDEVRPRLQRFLRAMYGESVTIETLNPEEPTTWKSRALKVVSGKSKAHIDSESDAECIRLPANLPSQSATVSLLEQYRLLAVQHAERIQRKSAMYAQAATSDLERDLFQLAEAACIDAHIRATQPGLRTTLESARATAMSERGAQRAKGSIESRVEELVRATWNGPIDRETPSDSRTLPLANDAEANAGWARETARKLAASVSADAVRTYRRVAEVALWRTATKTRFTDLLGGIPVAGEGATDSNLRSKSDREAPSGKKPVESEVDADNEQQKTEDGDNDSGDSGDGGQDSQNDQTPENDKSPTESAANAAGEKNDSEPPTGSAPEDAQDSGNRRVDDVEQKVTPGAATFVYPEWDFNAQNFNEAGTTVHVLPAELGEAGWAKAILQENGREVVRARQQFERLRSHRARLRRQVQGDELDLEACVEAMVDRRMHHAPTDRLYRQERPGRRELAITLLIDVSGSTREELAGEKRRVIDIEQITAAVATAAFDALGDDYSILTFSSAGAPNVHLRTVKEFGERNTSIVLQRIAALEPAGNTRLGAAVRHATALLNRHPAPHRLLLIISDGKPYDYDFYFVDYAVQDSRQAVMAARQHGIQPFCITIDSAEGSSYLPEIFGTTGYRVVSKPTQLAQALLLAVQRMIGSAS